jgi:dienelactone hydrolase
MKISSLPRSVLVAGLIVAAGSVTAQAPDPSVRGSFATTNAEYNLGDTAFTPPGFPAAVELRGVVFHPTNLAAGPFPLVLFLHGRHSTCFSGSTTALEWPCTAGRQPILSFRGYDYAADHLASHGYVVISISANGINARDNSTSDFGALARAQLIQRHLDQWRTYNTTGAAPFGTQFVGRVDLTRVGTMGHSRGGEGVMRHYIFNLTQPSPYPVKVIVPIAPTDFGRWQVNDGAFVAQLLPYCDGDVSDLQGVHFYDDARYNLTASGYRQYVTVLGANHNFFNTNWTPGSPFPSSDDWTAFVSGGSGDPHCGTGVGNGRLTAAQQRDVGLAYLTAYFRNQVGNESALLPWIDGTGGKPPAVSALALHVAFQPDDTRRRDLNRLQVQAELTTNNVGGAVSQSGLTPHDLCGGAAPQPQSCLTGQSSARDPHRSPSTTVAGLSRLRTGWGATTAVFTNDIPSGANRDVSSFQYFQFRSVVNFTDTRNAAGQPQDFSVRFTDGAGGTQTLRVGQFSNALYYPPGTVGPVPKVLTNGVRLPLSALTTVNKTNLARVEVLLNQQPTGAVFVADAHFYRSGSVAPTPDFGISCSPSSVSAAPGGSVTSTCTVTSTGGFSSAVALSCAGLPAGVSCAFAPSSVTPPANGSVNSTLTISVASGTAAGTSTFQARGTSGATVKNANVTLTVTGTAPVTVTFTSQGANDGRTWESTETSNVGGGFVSSDTSTAAIRVGDLTTDRSYRSVLSFDTSSIPDTATITAATVRLVRGTISGTNPFTILGTCQVDIRNGFFGTAVTLANADWEAAATATAVASLSNPTVNGAASTGTLNATGLAAISKTGTTQLKLYFTTDDNDNNAYDYIGFYGGEAATAGNRPTLTITYTP